MNMLLGIVIIGIIIYMVMRGRGRKGDKAPGRGRELVLQNVKPGGVIRLTGIGPDMRSFDLSIIAKHEYREDGFSWYELEGDNGSEKIWVEYEEDDEFLVSVSIKKCSMNDLPVSMKDIRSFRETGKGSIEFEGMTFRLDENGTALFLRDCDSAKGLKVSYTDFESEDEEYILTIEEWDAGGIEVHVSQYIDVSQISVYSIE